MCAWGGRGKGSRILAFFKKYKRMPNVEKSPFRPSVRPSVINSLWDFHEVMRREVLRKATSIGLRSVKIGSLATIYHFREWYISTSTYCIF